VPAQASAFLHHVRDDGDDRAHPRGARFAKGASAEQCTGPPTRAGRFSTAGLGSGRRGRGGEGTEEQARRSEIGGLDRTGHRARAGELEPQWDGRAPRQLHPPSTDPASVPAAAPVPRWPRARCTAWSGDDNAGKRQTTELARAAVGRARSTRATGSTALNVAITSNPINAAHSAANDRGIETGRQDERAEPPSGGSSHDVHRNGPVGTSPAGSTAIVVPTMSAATAHARPPHAARSVQQPGTGVTRSSRDHGSGAYGRPDAHGHLQVLRALDDLVIEEHFRRRARSRSGPCPSRRGPA